jgi:O-antigen/teichoic acid export membrane protein
LGEGNQEKLKKIFSTTMTVHILLALFIVLLAETLGLWFLYHKIVIPPERMHAAIWVFHLSLITAFFNLTQVPYNACILAHEKMSIYAYMSLAEAIGSLIIVYLLVLGHTDKLILFAFLHVLLQILKLSYYRYFCSRHFQEAHFTLSIDKGLLKEIGSFSGWSLFASASTALNGHGSLILLNIFFSPVVVVAMSISSQVNSAANLLIENLQKASLPQVVKLYASNQKKESEKLLLQTTKYSYYLMLLIALPIMFAADSLLRMWLVEVPDYTVAFLQLIMITGLFNVFNISFYRALYAKGQLKENALISPMIDFLRFPIVYLLFMMGYSPVALLVVGLVTVAILGLIVKPFLLVKIVDYSWKDVFGVFYSCLKVTIIALPAPLIVFLLTRNDGINLSQVLVLLISFVSVALSCWYIGIDFSIRKKVVAYAKGTIFRWF